MGQDMQKGRRTEIEFLTARAARPTGQRGFAADAAGEMPDRVVVQHLAAA